ncbi:MAG: tetratricopeptide repeat protein [Acidobacteriota bacterium]|nr:tetratricopeptide repeat protein [Acidobacteriota bacterium]
MQRPVMVKLALTLLLLGSLAFAQRRCEPGDLRVKVLYSNSRAVRNHTQVDLLRPSGTLIKQRFTDDTGNAEFLQIPAAGYRIRVTGPDVEETVSDEFSMDCGSPRAEMVTVKLKAEAEAVEKQLQAKEAMISALELNVPGGAHKEFEKGANALEGNRLPEAQKRFQRAIEIYPPYAMAYNHLGVVYMMTGQAAKGRAAFEKAVELNDRYPSALLNLAKLRYEDGKMQEVEALLRKAVAGDPRNGEMIFILCVAELQNGRLDDALGNAKKLHSLPHAQYAGVHYLAAQELEAKNRTNDAIAQYTLFLQEASPGVTADRARTALGRLRQQAATQPVSQPILQR